MSQVPLVLAEPQRFVRRSISRSALTHRRGPSSQWILSRSNDLLSPVPNSSQSVSQRAQHDNNELGSRAHYNRLIGRLVQEELHPHNPPNTSWSQVDLEWMMDIMGFSHDDLDLTIRSQLLGPDHLDFLERPRLDLLELPDRNEF
jgi:hypothetical protein